MKTKNPLYPLITDLQYSELVKLKVFNENEIRNIEIRAKFKNLKKTSDMKSGEIIEEINKDYLYLSYDTIYGIIYRHRGGAKDSAKESVERILTKLNHNL